MRTNTALMNQVFLPIFLVSMVMAFWPADGVNAEEKWVPGKPYPPALLDRYPCHDYDLPCGKLKPPPIEWVNFEGPLDGDAARGEKIATNLRWGNCIACHELPRYENGNSLAGTIGPSLANYAELGRPIAYTYQRIWDIRAFSPDAHMPIFGPFKVLTKAEIIDVMTYLYKKN